MDERTAASRKAHSGGYSPADESYVRRRPRAGEKSKLKHTAREEREIPRVGGAHVRLERLPSTGVVRGEAREQLAATGGALSGNGGGGDLRTDTSINARMPNARPCFDGSGEPSSILRSP
jgi:hypothetical protein